MSSAETVDLGVLLNIAFAAFKDALDADLAAAGFDDIGTSFGYVFRQLAEAPCNLSELSQHLGMTAPGALKVVDDMVAKGYVSRSLDAGDRRVKRLELTDRGLAALRRARTFHQQYEQELVARFGPRPVADLRKLLEAMAAASTRGNGRQPRPA